MPLVPLGTLERIGAGIGVKRVPTLPENFGANVIRLNCGSSPRRRIPTGHWGTTCSSRTPATTYTPRGVRPLSLESVSFFRYSVKPMRPRAGDAWLGDDCLQYAGVTAGGGTGRTITDSVSRLDNENGRRLYGFDLPEQGTGEHRILAALSGKPGADCRPRRN